VYRRVAIGVLLVVIVTVTVYAWRTGAVTPTSVQVWLDSLGPWAPVIFVAAFLAGSLIGLPGMAFVVGGRLAFGPWLGFALGFTGGMAAVLVPFLAMRVMRRPTAVPWQPRNRWLCRALERIETHPVRAVVVLRLLLWFNQPLSYALGVSPIRTRDYVRGCAISLVPVVAVASLATGWFL
jgi:uncharacterized membrane protein YdjX (TVP38/TMEM64 family)